MRLRPRLRRQRVAQVAQEQADHSVVVHGQQLGLEEAQDGDGRLVQQHLALHEVEVPDACREGERQVAGKERDEPRPRVDLARHAALLQVAVQRRQVGLHHRVQYAQPLLQDTF